MGQQIVAYAFERTVRDIFGANRVFLVSRSSGCPVVASPEKSSERSHPWSNPDKAHPFNANICALSSGDGISPWALLTTPQRQQREKAVGEAKRKQPRLN